MASQSPKKFYDNNKDEDLIADKRVLLPFNAVLMLSQWVAFAALVVYYSGPSAYVSTTTIETDYRYGYPKFNCTPLTISNYWRSRVGFDFCDEQVRTRPPSAETISNFENPDGPWEYKPFAHTGRGAPVPFVSLVLSEERWMAQQKYDALLNRTLEVMECAPILDLATFRYDDELSGSPVDHLGFVNGERDLETWQIRKSSGFKLGERISVPQVTPTYAYRACECRAVANFPRDGDDYQQYGRLDAVNGPFTEATCSESDSSDHCKTFLEAEEDDIYDLVQNRDNGTCVCKGYPYDSNYQINRTAIWYANISETDEGGYGPYQCEPVIQAAYNNYPNAIQMGQGSGGAGGTDDWKFIPEMVARNYTFSGELDTDQHVPSCINYLDDDWYQFSQYSGEGDERKVRIYDLIADDSCYYKWHEGYFQLVSEAERNDYSKFLALASAYERGLIVEECLMTPEKAKSVFQLALDEDNMFCSEFIDAPVFNCEQLAAPPVLQRFSLAYANSLLIYTVFSAICVKIFFANKKERGEGETDSTNEKPASLA